MIVNWKKPGAGILTIPCIQKINGVNVISKTLVLIPGHNDIPDKDWKIAKYSAKGKIETGLLEEIVVKTIVEKTIEKEVIKKIKAKNGKEEKVIVIEVQKKKEEIDATELKNIPAKKAREIIKDTWNLETLKNWLDKESRDEIRAVIYNQMETVNKEGEV